MGKYFNFFYSYYNDEEPTMKENTFEADPGGGYTYSHVIDGLGKEAAKLI